MATARDVDNSSGSPEPQHASIEEEHEKPAINTNIVEEEQAVSPESGESQEARHASPLEHGEPAINASIAGGEHTVQRQLCSSPAVATAGAAAAECCGIASDVPRTPVGAPTLKSVAGVGVANDATAAGDQPLSPEEIRHFEEDGFVMLKRAFDPAVAAAGR